MFSISSIRAKARETINQTPGSLFLAVLPVSLVLLVSLFQSATRKPALILQEISDEASLNRYLFAHLSFSFFFQLLLALLLLSVLLTLFQVIRNKKERISIKDSLAIFQSPDFGKIMRTFLLKGFYLFLWSILCILGICLLFGALGIAVLYTLETGDVTADMIPDEVAITISIFFLLGLVLMIAGLALYLPNYYAYSQVECILFDQLDKGQYAGAGAIIKESRYMMRGYKGKRLVLDLSFIGWFLLYGLTFGLVGIYVLPYYQAAQVHFYETLKPIVEAEKAAYLAFLQKQVYE